MTNPDNILEIDLSAPLNLPDLTNSAFSEKWLVDNRCLTFVLNDKVYALGAKWVAEVLPFPAITHLPRTPKWLSGVANLRGEIITVVDLFHFWNIETSASPVTPKLILLRSENDAQSVSTVAVKVDRVREVVVISDENIQEVENAPHLLGKIAYKTDFLYLLDVEKLLSKLHL